MTIKRLHAGPRMSQVVIHNGLAYLAGQVAKDPEKDVADQTRQVLATIDSPAGRSRQRQDAHPQRDDLPGGHGGLSHHERALGCMGVGRIDARAGHRAGQPGHPEVQGRDHGEWPPSA